MPCPHSLVEWWHCDGLGEIAIVVAWDLRGWTFLESSASSPEPLTAVAVKIRGVTTRGSEASPRAWPSPCPGTMARTLPPMPPPLPMPRLPPQPTRFIFPGPPLPMPPTPRLMLPSPPGMRPALPLPGVPRLTLPPTARPMLPPPPAKAAWHDCMRTTCDGAVASEGRQYFTSTRGVKVCGTGAAEAWASGTFNEARRGGGH
mmetsp:Transcript_57435/g.123498  ORF Transcript_57435/g.123498 Transcript_57435/m.123498 type:complete len:202 (+) Transcript_57435:322-927(+)